MESNSEPKAALYRLRPHDPTDVPFIYSSFLKSHRDSPTVAGIPNSLYYAGQHSVIERRLASPLAKVVVACAVDDPSQIYGYVIGVEGLCVDYTYVKHAFRGYGIARDLFACMHAKQYTHRCKQIDRLVKDRDLVFNPYLLFNGE